VTGRAGLDRCREELAAARLLADKGFTAQALSRAYYAAFFAAETALLALGETRSKHSGVISAFVHLLVRRGQLDEESGRLLRSLFERRNEADYSPVDVPLEEAGAAIRDAELVVGAVEAWLGRHGWATGPRR
jgi:uncharacterized protein (UPF0332 family)